MERSKVLIVSPLCSQAVERLRAEPGIEAAFLEEGTEGELINALKGARALVAAPGFPVTGEALFWADNLAAVAVAGMDVGAIDVEAATLKGIAVISAPGFGAETIAEHTIAMMLSLARRIPEADRSMRRGEWERERFVGRGVAGRTLGVIGAGRVGGGVARLAAGLGMRVIAHDPFITAERASGLGVLRVGLDTLLSTSDFISLHVPSGSFASAILGRENLKKVKYGALLTICSGGEFVDEDALHEAIKSGRIAGAALDVYPSEPPSMHPLYSLEEVITTPHLGSSTMEARESSDVEAVENVISYLKTGAARNLQNAPSVPAETLCLLTPYLDLAAKMGRFLAQTVDGPIERVKVTSWGDAAGRGAEMTAAAAVRGLLLARMGGRVNDVNALAVASERGMSVSWGESPEVRDFVNLVEVEISGPWGKRQAEGAIFGKRDARLVSFDGYRIEARPSGEMILIFNRDVPGVIGAVGGTLGELGVNIAGFYNGREETGGRAITLVNVDGPVTGEALAAVAALENVQSARRISV